MKRIGLIVLASDLTIEHEWRAMMPDGVNFYVSRIQYANSCTPDGLRAMAERIETSASLILPGIGMDVMAYACTSASVAIGPAALTKRIQTVHPSSPVALPITAAVDALNHVQARRIGVLAPYLEETSESIFAYFSDSGFQVAATKALGIETDYDIAAVDEDTIWRSCEQMNGPDIDALFLSCTALEVAHLIEPLEARFGKPVLCSNQVLLWQSLQLLEPSAVHRLPYGRLFQI